MGIFLIICIVVNYVCGYYAAKINIEGRALKKSNKNDTENKANKNDISNILFIASIVLSIISSILIVKLMNSNSKGGAVGQYNYYVNGKKVSSSTYFATQDFLIGFFMFVMLFGSALGIPANIIEKRKKNKEKIKVDPIESSNKKPNVVALIFSCLAEFFGITLIMTSICAIANVIKSNSASSPYVALFLGLMMIALGTMGIRTFIIRSKNYKNK